MKRPWIPVAIVTSLGLFTVVSLTVLSIASQVDYGVDSYSVLYLDNEGITFRYLFWVKNPTSYNLEVWAQKYDAYLAGIKISEITQANRYSLVAYNKSEIPLDVSFKWVDVQQKLAPFLSQSEVTNLGDLTVLIKGTLTAKMGILKITHFPFKISMPLSYLLPQ